MNNNPQNYDCPPLMSDGRHFTDYRPNCYVHYLIMKQNNINNSYDLKHLLTHNGLKFQDIERQFYINKNNCVSCGQYYLVDPNHHNEYWDAYKKRIGLGK